MKERQILPTFLRGNRARPCFRKFTEEEIRGEFLLDPEVGSAMMIHNHTHTFYEDAALPAYQDALASKAKIPRPYRPLVGTIFADLEEMVNGVGDNVRAMPGIPDRLKHPHD